MKRLTAIYVLLLLLVIGCAAREPVIKYEMVEVKVPVQVFAIPPAWLLVPIEAGSPIFISPDDPEASSSLSRDGEQSLKRLLLEYHDRVQAWHNWSGNISQ